MGFLRIGVVCYPSVGGSGIFATRLGLKLAERGHQLHFISSDRPVELQGLEPENVAVHLVPVVDYPLFKHPPYTVALASEISRVSERFDLDLVHVHYAIPHATAALLARMVTATPYIVTLHGSDVTILGGEPALRPVNTLSIDRADGLTAVSRYLAEEARERLGVRKEIAVIHNFVDTDLYTPPAPDSDPRSGGRGSVVIHISNFRPVKRVQDLVEAMALVVREDRDARLLLVGDGPERDGVERLVDRLGLGRSVTFTGYRRDVPDLLRRSDILVVCSDIEGASLTLIEGMSSGLPVVATGVGGVPELMTSGGEGFLIPPKSPRDLAERILQLDADPELRLRMGSAARRTAIERFSPERVVPLYEEVYRRAVSS